MYSRDEGIQAIIELQALAGIAESPEKAGVGLGWHEPNSTTDHGERASGGLQAANRPHRQTAVGKCPGELGVSAMVMDGMAAELRLKEIAKEGLTDRNFREFLQLVRRVFTPVVSEVVVRPLLEWHKREQASAVQDARKVTVLELKALMGLK